MMTEQKFKRLEEKRHIELHCRMKLELCGIIPCYLTPIPL